MKEGHCMRDCVLFKKWLEKKEFRDTNPGKDDEAIRVTNGVEVDMEV
jgi:hypothetical protein